MDRDSRMMLSGDSGIQVSDGTTPSPAKVEPTLTVAVRQHISLPAPPVQTLRNGSCEATAEQSSGASLNRDESQHLRSRICGSGISGLSRRARPHGDWCRSERRQGGAYQLRARARGGSGARGADPPRGRRETAARRPRTPGAPFSSPRSRSSACPRRVRPMGTWIFAISRESALRSARRCAKSVTSTWWSCARPSYPGRSRDSSSRR